MGIRIAHEPVVTPLIAAYATGVGNARERQATRATDILREQQQNRLRLHMQDQQNQFTMGRDKLNFDREKTLFDERNKFMADRDDAARRWEYIQEGRKRGEFDYTPEQHADWKRYNAEVAGFMTDDTLTDEERASAIAQARKKQQDIMMNPQPVMPSEKPSLEERAKASTYTDEWGNIRYVDPETGQLGPVDRNAFHPKRAEYEARIEQGKRYNEQQDKIRDAEAKLWDSIHRRRNELEKQTKQDANSLTPSPRYKPEQIEDIISREFASQWGALHDWRRSIQQPQPQPQQPQQPQQPGQPPRQGGGAGPSEMMMEEEGWERRTTPDGREFWYNSSEKRHQRIAEQQNRDYPIQQKSADQMAAEAVDFRGWAANLDMSSYGKPPQQQAAAPQPPAPGMPAVPEGMDPAKHHSLVSQAANLYQDVQDPSLSYAALRQLPVVDVSGGYPTDLKERGFQRGQHVLGTDGRVFIVE